MVMLLVVVALFLGLAGFSMTTPATEGVAIVGLGGLVMIGARLTQAAIHESRRTPRAADYPRAAGSWRDIAAVLALVLLVAGGAAFLNREQTEDGDPHAYNASDAHSACVQHAAAKGLTVRSSYDPASVTDDGNGRFSVVLSLSDRTTRCAVEWLTGTSYKLLSLN